MRIRAIAPWRRRTIVLISALLVGGGLRCSDPGPDPAKVLASVGVSPTATTIIVGQSTQLSATATSVAGTALANRVFTWATNNTTVATVDTIGVVRALSPGTAAIAVFDGGKSAMSTITVWPIPVASVRVSEVSAPGSANSQNAHIGETLQFSAAALDANGGALQGRTVEWTTSNSAVALIASNGLVSAIAPGTATLTATIEGRSADATMTVVIEPAGMTLISERAFSCITFACAEAAGWEYQPTIYGGMTVELDPTAPKTPSSVLRSTVPINFPAGEANGVMQRSLGPMAIPAAPPVRVLYISLWAMVSSEYEGNQSSNNKLMYVRWNGTNGAYASSGTFEALGSGSDPLYSGTIFNNLGAPYPDDFGNLDVTIKRSNRPGFADGTSEIARGVWYRFEFVLTMNTPGVANGTWEYWQNGVRKQNLTNLMFVPVGVAADWRFIELTPSWGGSGASSTRSFFTQYDHVYISGK